jgi:hypothetical protein
VDEELTGGGSKRSEEKDGKVTFEADKWEEVQA